MYLIALPPNRLGSKVYTLVDALADAKERGVDVRIILDQNIDWTVDNNLAFWDPAGKNNKAYRYLKEKGVTVFFDDKAVFTHAKALVIDGKTVILGSANWSESAFSKNVETNVLIQSEELAKEILEGFKALELYAPETVDHATVPVAWAFLNDPELLGKMVSSRDKRVFDLYLFLLKSFDGNGEGRIVLSYPAMAEGMGIEPKPELRYWRTVRRALTRLQDKYRLLSFSYKRGTDPIILLKLIEAPGGPYRPPQEEIVEVPITYWAWGWDQKLTFSGKVMYLLSQMYTDLSPLAPVWFRSQEDLAEKHGFEEHFVQEGVLDLRRHNLIEVRTDLNPEDFRDRKANEYVANPLYDPKELSQAFKDLDGRYGKGKVERARGYISLVYEDSDIEAVERLILLEEEFGSDVVASAVSVVSDMSGNNPKKTIGYLVNTIRGMGRRETEKVLQDS